MLEQFNKFLATPIGPLKVDQLLNVLIIAAVSWLLVRLIGKFADRALTHARVERSLFTSILRPQRARGPLVPGFRRAHAWAAV